MVLHNPNNWHWVSKNAGEWTKLWFDETLTKISAEEGEVTAKINKVVSMDGDVDVSQRKGKVITIYDVKLVLEYTGMSILYLAIVTESSHLTGCRIRSGCRGSLGHHYCARNRPRYRGR